MGRRGTGLIVLTVALTLTLIAPRLFQPGVAGSPTALSFPSAPHVGDCVDLVGSDLVSASCRDPHDAEVTARWTADDPRRPADPAAARCADKATEWAGVNATTTSDWTPAFEVTDLYISQPQIAGWSACILRPASGVRYPGTARGAAWSTDRPAAFGRCQHGADPVSCIDPHDVEYLGSPTVVDASTAELTTACTALARRLMATQDPTAGGRLAVRVPVFSTGDDEQPMSVLASCTILSTGPPLVDSVFGLGTGPLPFA